MIGNGHLDVVWLWPWWEGLEEAWSTFRSALDRMREHPEFRFAASSAAYYDWVERLDPAMFKEIRERVAEGRWELVGGWWVEPDCNIPGGEALVRQVLQGQRYFRSRFGRTAEVGFNIDSFGHAATLPQLLSKAGLRAYCFFRPGPHERDLPGHAFWWKAADGSRTLAYRIPFQYQTGPEQLTSHIERCLAELGGHGPIACFYGVGNHGGGPTRANIEAIDRLRDRMPGVHVTFGSLGSFFDAVEGSGIALPVHEGELQHHASGCYAAHSGIKRGNRRAEQKLLAAEKAQVLALRMGALKAPGDLSQAWRSVLFNQFHDILAGTSIEPAYDDARDLHGEAAAQADRELHRSLQAVAIHVDVAHREGTTPLVVFNPHSWRARTVVELEAGRLDGARAIEDERGRVRPLQDLRPQATVNQGRRRVAFLADLPPLGYRVYRAVAGEGPEEPDAPRRYVLEDERLRLEIDPATGQIASLFDKQRDLEVLAGPGGRAVVVADDSDTWSHDRTRFQEVVGEFEVVLVRHVEHGPVKSVLRVESRYGRSTLTQDFALLHGLGSIVVDVNVDWHERWQALKLRWPVDVVDGRASYEIAHGSVERPADGEEEPAQGWIDLSGTHPGTGAVHGLSLLNDGKFSHDVEGRVMSLTVLRSPVYAHHDPRRLTPEEGDDVHFIDQGAQRFTYALLPHEGGWREAGTVRRAAELNQPAVAFWHTGHPGKLPSACSLLEIEPASVVLTALKPAEDGRGDTILRCLETVGRETVARIRLHGWERELEVRLGANELKTLRVPADHERPVTETDLVELADRPL
jgi:alpha-mannosidase